MKDTSWSGVSKWYDELVKEEGSYQRSLILPNLLRRMDIKRGDNVLDLACGQGFFSREFARAGGNVIGADVAGELIKIAIASTNNNLPAGGTRIRIKPKFFVASAHKLDFIKSGSMDKVVIVLAIQNIENIGDVLAECARVLEKGGKLFIVMNHPAFRIPKQSSWGYDETNKIQYRRVDEYMSESKVAIQMHPGGKPSEMTVSFHRPMQVYFKALHKSGFAVSGLEEWISNKTSEPGPKAKVENKARKEIPLFMLLEAVKL